MIAYLIHTGVISNGRIGGMWVTSNDGARHHSNTRVKTGCSSLSFQVSWNNVRTALFSPSTFQIGASGDYSVGLVIHVGKMGDNEKIGTTEER